MILNAYAVLAAALSLLQLLTGGLVVALAAGALGQARRLTGLERTAWLEDRGYLVMLLAMLLVAINFASWPLLYLLLQSYVPEWDGVMCIYGVTRVGAGSQGPAGYLPALLGLLQLTKPALVFLSGAWLALYRVNRRTSFSPLFGRVMLALAALGALAAADAAAELAYLAIPKKDDAHSVGCCTEPSGADDRFAPRARLSEAQRPWLAGAFYAGNAAMAAGAWLAQRRPVVAVLAPLAAGALLTLSINLLFLSEIAAPTILRQPFHHCPYDLAPRAPEALVPVAMLVLAAFDVGWALVTVAAGRAAETEYFLGDEARVALRPAVFFHLAGAAMLSLGMALA